MVYWFETKLLRHLFLQSSPLLLFTKLGTFRKIYGRRMTLVVLRFVTGSVWSNVKCLHMIAIDDAADRFVRIVFAVGLHWCLSIKRFDARAGQISGVGNQRPNVILNFEPLG